MTESQSSKVVGANVASLAAVGHNPHRPGGGAVLFPGPA